MFTGPGRYTFRSLYLPDRCIDIPSPIAHRDEGRVQQFTLWGSVYQKWMVVEEPGDGVYVIHSTLGPSKVLGIEGDSRDDFARVHFQRASGSAFQRWRFVSAAEEAYRIVNEGSGCCIDLREQTRYAGGDLQQRPRLDFPHQLWAIEPA
jgi:hypothetical protein